MCPAKSQLWSDMMYREIESIHFVFTSTTNLKHKVQHSKPLFNYLSEALEAARPIGAGAYLGFCSMKWLEVFLLPLYGMLVHRRSLPRKLSGFPQQFAGTHLYTWVERGTVRVKCLA